MAIDLIIHNACIKTMQDVEPAGLTAIAIAGKCIADLGSDEAILALAENATRLIDAEGATLLPGFYESHMHIFEGSVSLEKLNVASIMGVDSLKEAVAAFVKAQETTDLIMCFGAQYTIFGDERPTRHHLDRVEADIPLYIVATDYHTAWANTRALEKADILQGRDLGAEGEIVMGDDGLATGELREFKAMEHVSALRQKGGRETLGLTGDEPQHVADHAIAEDMALLMNGLRYCAKNGITKIINMDGNAYQMDLLSSIEQQQGLPCRIDMPLTVNPHHTEGAVAKATALKNRFHSDKLSLTRLKLFMDGVFDSWTAYVVDEYPDRPGFKSVPLFDQATFNDICQAADIQDLQICVHAVGDGAVRAVIDGYAETEKKNGRKDRRNRIEHIDTIQPDDIPRLSQHQIIASMQPVHPPGSAGLPLEPTISLMGKARWATAFPWRAIADHGTTIAFGTDWPISPINPLYAMQCALTRKPWAIDNPDQRLTLDECLKAYTRNGAYAAFDETRLGQIREGYLADIVLLKGNLENLKQENAPLPEVMLTFCDGQITYQRSAT